MPRRRNPKPEDEEDLTGLVCQRCGCADLRVVYVRHLPNDRVLRRRDCRHCGKPKITIEQEGAP